MFTYRKILQVTPGLKEIINNPKRADELTDITQKMNKTIHSTRSIDATSLKKQIVQYLLPDPHKEGLKPSIVNGCGQAEMGLKHPVLAHFLCPVDQLEAYDKDPARTHKLLECGNISMNAGNFPAILWSGNVLPGDDWNAENMNDSLFQSYVLTQVAHHIFKGPTCTLNDEGKEGLKQSNAELHDMMTMEPKHIAYVCMQTCFRISSMLTWNEKDREFSYWEFYNNIISYICNAVDKEWRDDLLRWWNVQVILQLFGNEKGRVFNADIKKDTSASSSGSGPQTVMEKMQAQIKAQMEVSSGECAGAEDEPKSPPASNHHSWSNGEQASPWAMTTPQAADDPMEDTPEDNGNT
ncbi:hypothetical protein JVU11DRAFT_11522 [Chiua virens]|nr:hypothetical protein JVU11DRAFT_11522 [Chiua virens]